MPPSAHGKLPLSGSPMWANCPGSIKANEAFPDRGSAFAQEGTLAHNIAEACLTNDTDPLEYKDTVMGQDMAEYIAEYVYYVKAIPGTHYYEVRVNLSEWIPDGFGTSDAVIVHNGTAHVVDLKYGKGIKVFAEKNPQAMLYALGVYSMYDMVEDIERFILHIVQPRLDHIDVWEVSLKELLAFGEWIKERAALALSDDAPRIPGDKQCQWCRAKAVCPELADYTAKVIGCEFDDLTDLENPDQIGVKRIGQILQAKPLITSWLSAVESHAFKLANDGGLPGFKLVEGRSNRAWRDEAEAQKTLLEMADEATLFERKFISPAKAEKILGKTKAKEIQTLIVKPTGKPTLVPESDPRQPFNEVADDFTTIE